MTKIKFLIDNAEVQDEHRATIFNYLAVEIDGHTETEPCMLLSAVSQACASTLMNIVGSDDFAFTKDDETGYMFFGLGEGAYITSASDTAFDVLYIAVLQLMAEYPDAIEREVLVWDQTVKTDAQE